MSAAIQDNIEVMVDPKSHIPHLLLWVAGAGMTIAYAANSLQPDNLRSVALTNLKMLRPADLVSPAASTRVALLRRWRCTTVAGAVVPGDPWGPDSMCRCISKHADAACSSLETCKEFEDKCYAQVVPVYGQVYAGVDTSSLNIVIAFFLIHIAVLLNMAAETAKEKAASHEPATGKPAAVISTTQEDEVAYRKGLDGSTADVASANANDAYLPAEAYAANDRFDLGNTDPLYANSRVPSVGYASKFSANGNIMRNFATFGPKYQKVNGVTYEGDQPLEDTDVLVNEGEPLVGGSANTGLADHRNKLAETYAARFAQFMKQPLLRLALMAVLAATCFGLTVWRQTNLIDNIKEKEQKCDLENPCVTQDFLSAFLFAVTILDLGMCLVIGIMEAVKIDGQNPFVHSEFAISTWEDLHNMLAFMLLAASFSAQSGVHDDTTVLFDVLVVLFIGFMQSVQHNIMLIKEVFIKHCMKDVTSFVQLTDTQHTTYSVSDTILSFFLYTRLFIFVIITGSSFVFFERLDTSVGAGGTTASWNGYMRFVASLVSLTPSFFGDMSYEAVHSFYLKRTNEHVVYSGAATWRRTVYLMYIIVFVLVSFKTYPVVRPVAT